MPENPVLSVVICYRDWGGDRLRLAVASHLRSTLLDRVEVIVSDFGSESERKAEKALAGLSARIVYTPTDEPWSRGRALNAGVAQARGDYVLAWDADIVCGPELHRILLTHVEAQPEAVYIFQCRDLDRLFGEESVRRYLENGQDLPLEEMRDHSSWRPRWGMGIAACRRTDFDLIRGYDERFSVWGGEDRDLANRFNRVGLPARWIEHAEAEIYHIFHESSQDKARESSAGQAALQRNHDYIRKDFTVFRNLCSPAYFRSARPLVSVVIATYNRARFIRESVQSVLDQTFSDLELLVIDDGSTDGTVETLDGIDDERLRVVRKENGGVASARNKAAALARGHFIVVHDDDDIMLPDRIETHLAALTGNKAGSYGGWVDFDDETGRFIQINPGKDFSPESIAYAGKVLLHPTVMTTRWTALRVPYDERYKGGSDFNWMMTIADAGCELVHTGRIHILRRVHGDSLTTSGSGQKHASRASVRSLHSGLSRDSIGEIRDRGRNTGLSLGRNEPPVRELYRFLPVSLRRHRRRFEVTVDVANLDRLLKMIRREQGGLLLERLAPLAVGGTFTTAVWSAEGWAESEAATDALADIGRCVVKEVPGPVTVVPGANETLFGQGWKPPANEKPQPLAPRFPRETWALLDRVTAHKGLTAGGGMLIAARARTEKQVSVKKADRLVRVAAVRGVTVEKLVLVQSAEGSVPVYRMTGATAGGWLEKLARKWALEHIALAFVEPAGIDTQHGGGE